ncbi:hypothetical protein L2089_05325 [Paenibacillus hunanensis]|uniref:hypothetical protein n=1 Tax=Paenibacillus hunanensis TaxID=539262 RepID=UPI002025C034|nr:hypothetical protein [Paenibacillus hunanensis]MCL9660097.1 hypothetical protein [Paenibacillus hunanensis]
MSTLTGMVVFLWLLVSVVFATAAIYFTRQHVLRGRYAVLWLSTSFFMLGASMLSMYGISGNM